MTTLSIFAYIIFSFFASPTCQCLPISVKENFEKSTRVFSGIVVAVDTLKQFDNDLPKGAFRELYSATLKVHKTYKGRTLNGTIRVITGNSYADCGYEFSLEKKFIIYGVEKSYSTIDSTILPSLEAIVSKNTFIYTDNCDRTTSDIIKEDKLLNQLLARRKMLQHYRK